jgi:hypothetical protein
VSPVRYELGFYIPEDAILHSDRREHRKPHSAVSVPQTRVDCGRTITPVGKWARLWCCVAACPHGLFIESGGHCDVSPEREERGRGAVTTGSRRVSVHGDRGMGKSDGNVAATFEIQIAHNSNNSITASTAEGKFREC